MSLKKIKFLDTTLRDGEQTPGVVLSVDDKTRIAHRLERLGIDIIEAGFANASAGDFKSVGAVAKVAEVSTVASLCRCINADIDASWEALKGAVDPRLHIFIATSPVHMQYKLKMTPEEVLENAVAAVKYASKYTSNIQFSAEDAGRSDREFLAKIVKAVIEAGATTVNIPDTVGYCCPAEFGALIRYLFENVSNIEKAAISVHCHNDLGMAVANSLAAVENGAVQIEGCINGIGERAGNAALEEIIMNLTARKDYYKAEHNIRTEKLCKTSRVVATLTGIDCPPTKAIVGANAFSHESGIHQHGMLENRNTYEIITPQSVGANETNLVLGKLSGKHAFESRIKEFGFKLSRETLDKLFERFKELADRKKYVTDADIEAMLLSVSGSTEDIYELKTFQIFSGNILTATATIELEKNGQTYSAASTGNGAVMSAFNAINCIVGQYSLARYSLRAVTEGADALGEVNVRLIKDGNEYTGRGVATDVLEASIRAYVNAVNKSLTQEVLK